MKQASFIRAAAVLACVPLVAGAQTAETPGSQRQLLYRSAFADYKQYQDVEQGDWRTLNDALGAAAQKPNGGHAAHGAAGTASPAASAAPKAGMPRGGMEMPHRSDMHKKMHGGSR